MGKTNWIGELIFRVRQAQGLTQDQYGSKFNVSGPAVFKFEKGYVKPSLQLWLKMATDAGLPERRAVLVWVKSKLPAEYEEYIELLGPTEPAPKSKKGTDYARLKSREAIIETAVGDADLPAGLREMVQDNELWALYKPTGVEVNRLRDIFGPLGKGSKAAYREALGVLRQFSTV